MADEWVGYSRRKKEQEEVEARDGVRDDLTGPRLPSAVLGALMGLLGVAAVLGAEASTVGWFHLGLPDMQVGAAIAVAYIAIGLVLGFLSGLSGVQGGRFAAVFGGALLGWVLSPAAMSWCTQAGMPAFIGLLMPFVFGGLGFVFGQLARMGRIALGGGFAAVALATFAAPIYADLVGDAFSPLGMTLVAICALLSLAMGAVLAYAGQRGGNGVTVITLLVWALVWVGLAVPPLQAGPQSEFPIATRDGTPVVLIVIDAFRADSVGVLKSTWKATPELDAAARRGMIYTDATSAAPWVLPGLASIVSGDLAWKHGAGVNDGTRNLRGPIRADIPTIASRLGKLGYTTFGATGDSWTSARYGFGHGFARWDDRPGPTQEPALLAPLLRMGISPIPWPERRAGRLVVDQGIGFVQAQAAAGGHSRWYLQLVLSDLAYDLHPSEADLAAVGDLQTASGIRDYAAAVHGVDAELGRLLDVLPKDALVIIVGSSGAVLDESRIRVPPAFEGERNGTSLYQEQVHVPLVILGPGIPADRVTRPVSTLDIAPSLMRLVGQPFPNDTNGQPLVELVGGEIPPDRIIAAEGPKVGPAVRVARIGVFKLMNDGSEQFYDLGHDETEKEALVGNSALDLVWRDKLAAGLPPIPGGMAESPSVGAEMRDLVERLGLAGQPEVTEEAPPR